MEKENSVDLIKRLISNNISKEEFDALLEGIDNEETSKVYEESLRSHFDEIMKQYTLNKEEGKTEKIKINEKTKNYPKQQNV